MSMLPHPVSRPATRYRRAASTLVSVLSLSAGAALADPPNPVDNETGRPYFIIGVYDYPQSTMPSALQLQEMAAAGINTFQAKMQTATAADLDRAYKYGLRVIPYSYTWGEPDNWTRDVSFHVPGSALDQKIQSLKNSRGLLWYSHQDEAGWVWRDAELGGRPYTDVPSYEASISYRDFLRARDPAHPIWYVEASYASSYVSSKLSMSEMRMWANISDINSQDIYPVDGVNMQDCDRSVYTNADDCPTNFPNNPLNLVGDTTEALKEVTATTWLPPGPSMCPSRPPSPSSTSSWARDSGSGAALWNTSHARPSPRRDLWPTPRSSTAPAGSSGGAPPTSSPPPASGATFGGWPASCAHWSPRCPLPPSTRR